MFPNEIKGKDIPRKQTQKGLRAKMARKNSTNGKIDTAETKASEVEKAVHVVLGAPAAVADVVTETVDRLKDSAEREKELNNLRTQVERGIEIAEKRGLEIRSQLPSQVERGLKVAEQRGEEIRRQVTDQAKVTRERVEPAVRKYSAQARERSRKVSDQTQEQFRKTQERVRELV
jgi:hypothetical protein